MDWDGEFKNTFAKRLRSLRKEHGFKSAKDFCEASGIPYARYLDYELGRSSMRLDIACHICELLDCSLDYLVGRVESKPMDSTQTKLNDYYTELSDEGKGVAVRQLEGMTYVYK